MKKFFLTLITLIVLGAIALVITTTVLNNKAAEDVERTLSSMKMPADTECVSSVFATGKLTSDAAGMQYFGAIMIKSSLPENTLKEYFKGYEVKPQKENKIEVLDRANLSFDVIPYTGVSYYIVYGWGSCDFPLRNLDFRNFS